MTVDILRGDIAALPSAGRAEELLPAADGDSLTLACTDGELKSAYRVLRAVMNYGYEHEHPVHVRLVCADEAGVQGLFLPVEYVVCRTQA